MRVYRSSCWVVLILTALSGCAQQSPYIPSDTSASNAPASGITVFGEIDTSVVHTR